MLFRAKKSTTAVTKNDLLKFIRNLSTSSGQTIEHDTELMEAGLLDSVAIMELVLWLEKEKNVSIEEEDMLPENFSSVQILHDFIEAKEA